MNKRTLAHKVSEDTGIMVSVVEKVINSAADTIANAVESGEMVTLARFGTFFQKHHAGRIVADPNNPTKRIFVNPKTSVGFRPSKKRSDS